MPDSPHEWLDAAAAKRFFRRAARSAATADVLLREIESRMAERLDLVRIAPRLVLDAGCGADTASALIAKRYPKSAVIGIDLTLEMLQQAQRGGSRSGSPAGSIGDSLRARVKSLLARRSPGLVCGDFARLPFAAGSFGLAWSNLALAWAADPLPVFAEFHRVLEAGGLLMFSTYGPDTLKELRAAFAAADALSHTNRFIDMHDLGDMLAAGGFVTPVMDMEILTLTYPDFAALARDLRSSGQLNAAAARRRGLTGRRAWQRMQDAYEAMRRDGRLPATVEVIYGHAWRGEPRVTKDGRSIVQLEFATRKKIRAD